MLADSPGRRARPWRIHLQLRSRITIGFALVATALCITLTTITYLATRSSLVSQVLQAVSNTALANALIVQNQAHNFVSTTKTPLTTDQVNESAIEVLTGIDLAASPPTLSLLRLDGRWITDQTSSVLRGSDLPRSIVGLSSLFGQPYEQVFDLHGSSAIAVGVPLASVGAVYYEVFRPTQTVQTLHTLLATLLLASLVAIALAGVLGRWAATRVLRPLREVSEAALDIARGSLTTRIDTQDESDDLALLASSFNRMVDQLQERIEREARFTSDVAHELRSPLTTLANSVSVLEGRRDDLTERTRQALDLLSAEVRRFRRMVSDLLEISRFDSGSAEFEPSMVSVGEVIRRALQHSGASSVELVIDASLENRRVVVDKRRFERIIGNLIENADRYAGGAARVVVEADQDRVRIAIEDHGPGVRAEERERIFDRFARGQHDAGSRGSGDGTGLGLALVSEHVKLHNGRVFEEDAPGGGARFVVELPLQGGTIAQAFDREQDRTGAFDLDDEDRVEADGQLSMRQTSEAATLGPTDGIAPPR